MTQLRFLVLRRFPFRILYLSLCCTAAFAGPRAMAAGAALEPPSNSDVIPSDISPRHWAYEAVDDLARKGLLLGYPPTGNFLGTRSVTRYELAVIVKRAIDYLAKQQAREVSAAPSPVQNVTAASVSADSVKPAAPAYDAEDIAALRRLIDGLQTELVVIGADINVLKSQMKVVQEQTAAARRESSEASREAASAYGPPDSGASSDLHRRFTLGGYIQTRYLSGPTSGHLFPEGADAKTSPYNGNYAEGGNLPSFVLRRARVEIRGAATENTRYAISIEGSQIGAGTENTIMRQAAVSYTFGSGDARRFPTFTAGLFSVPFGYYLNTSPSLFYLPERPLLANETGAGLFSQQDWDKGARLDYTRRAVTGTVALLNGTGYASSAVHRNIDKVYRVSARSDRGLGLGVSYYDGQLPGSGIGSGDAFSASGLPNPSPGYISRQRRLIGADARYMPTYGPFVITEYVAGRYEQISAFGLTTTTLTNLQGYGTIDAPGNEVRGYTAQAGWHFAMRENRPLTVFASWDVLQRSVKGRPNSGSAWDDRTPGIGALYNLDSAARLRLFVSRPEHVAFAPTPAAPIYGKSNLTLTTAELQLRF